MGRKAKIRQVGRGAASVMSPAYIAEVASARYRGRLATVQQIAIIGGLSAPS